MSNCSIALQVLPQVDDSIKVCGGNGLEAVYKVVDEVIAYINSTGVKYEVGPFETTMEGDFETLMNIVKEAQLICVKSGAGSVMSYVKIAYNPDGVSTIEDKVEKHR